ncbi:Aldo/keto reductase [Rickenella mellea]|uniref:Aldo/keto reductase n=1 Tax=Rickenella mellea TaxID=50990 RepID=A0A4R5XDJ7_9AGAM|nr:Aldo/keto reductase [Rickenella mellea]
MAATVPQFTLNDGTKIHAVGMGTFVGKDTGFEPRAELLVKNAIKHGYRHIDTAFAYGTEQAVGKEIRESGLPREDFYVTTKLSSRYHDRVREGFDLSLKSLNLDYVDLYLMHWPQARKANGDTLQPEEYPTIIDTWKDMEGLLETGKVKSIGVSNFSIKTLEQLLPHAKVIPAVNQVELHPALQQPELLAYCKSKGIHLTAYTPLGSGSSPFYKHDTFLAIAAKHDATVAQVLLSWGVQRGTAVVPKSENEHRMAQNISLIKLDDDDMQQINNLHGQPGFKRGLLSYFKDGKVDGWAPEQLGWDYSD